MSTIISMLLGLVQVSSASGLASAVANADPGDVIEVRGGSYAVNLVITRDGTSDRPITLRSAPGQTVVLSARDTTLRTIDLQSASYWRLEDLKVRGSRHSNIRITGGTNIRIDGCEVYDGTKKGIIANGDLITIRNSIIRDIRQPLGGEDTEGIVAWRASRLRIYDNFIATPGDGILIGGANEDTRISTDVRIYRNHIHTRSAWYGVYKIENAIDIKAADGVVITDNEMHRYDDHPKMDGGVALLVQSHDEGAPDLRIDDVRVERNKIYDAGRAIVIKSVHGPGSDIDVRRNVIYAITQENVDDGKYAGGIFVADWSNVDIDNNTFVDVDSAAVRAWGSVSGLDIRNNIFRRSGGIVRDGVGGYVDYSCRYSTSGISGSHDVVGNQRFVDDAGRDYRLAAGSPCIDRGMDVGLSYDGTRPDMGRYEYASGTTIARLLPPDEGLLPDLPPRDGRTVDWASAPEADDREAELGPPIGEETVPDDAVAILEDDPPPAGNDQAGPGGAPGADAGAGMTTAGVADRGAGGGCAVGARQGASGAIALALLAGTAVLLARKRRSA